MRALVSIEYHSAALSSGLIRPLSPRPAPNNVKPQTACADTLPQGILGGPRELTVLLRSMAFLVAI